MFNELAWKDENWNSLNDNNIGDWTITIVAWLQIDTYYNIYIESLKNILVKFLVTGYSLDFWVKCTNKPKLKMFMISVTNRLLVHVLP